MRQVEATPHARGACPRWCCLASRSTVADELQASGTTKVEPAAPTCSSCRHVPRPLVVLALPAAVAASGQAGCTKVADELQASSAMEVEPSTSGRSTCRPAAGARAGDA